MQEDEWNFMSSMRGKLAQKRHKFMVYYVNHEIWSSMLNILTLLCLTAVDIRSLSVFVCEKI